MTTTRRNLLKFVGGGAAGALLTPAPWRLITDTALWSENWPGIPRPARGEIRARFTHCTLCPAGCAVRARCVNGQPVSLAGVKPHPISHGALCPWGVAGHHLPYHPARVRQGPVKEALAAVARALSQRGAGERVAVLDLRPGRTVSWTYRRAMAAMDGGLYLTPHQPAYAIDLAAAQTVVSFGAPLFDGWGTPGNVFAARANFRLVQIEPVETRTAALADVWLPIRPGTETAMAAALAGEITIAETACATGVEEEAIGALKEAIAGGPAVVLAADSASPLMSLNGKLHALGHTVVARREAPVPEAWKKAAPATEVAVVPDRAIRVLLIDESLPGGYVRWQEIQPKLAANAVVVVFSSTSEGYARHAQYVLPAPVYPEAAEDVGPAIDTVAAVFRIAAPLVAPVVPVVNPGELVARIAGLPQADPLRERANAIYKAGRGTLLSYADGKSTPAKEVTADDFWKTLNQGGCWMDDSGKNAAPGKLEFRAAGEPPRDDLPLTVVVAEMRRDGLESPLMSKLERESNLRLSANRVAISPADAHANGIENGGRCVLETACGRLNVVVTIDAGVPAGVVEISGGPRMADLCGASQRARVVRA
ncbi:MAG: molybdopterin dinucleotide binding domain-containing protein [Bryobacteraceae bacterium]|jgi:anaerobic selenocysteine-containing dehydrogenase